MSDTIIDMDYRLVDSLRSDQLEVDDLIGLNNEVVKIIGIVGSKTGYIVTVENDFSERDVIEIDDEEYFDLFILE